MTLALTLGMTIGVKRTGWMMVGELVGVALVAGSAALGVAALMLNYPDIFILFKYLGGLYLGYLGIQQWRSKGKLALTNDTTNLPVNTVWQLALQGFITAVVNPKGWAFFVVLLPPFIDTSIPIAEQLVLLILIILLLELCCLIIYASGGQMLKRLLLHSGNVRLMNRLSGSLMMGVGIWLAFG